MSQIKKFIDKVANAEGRQAKDLLMPIHDAKQLRDEVVGLGVTDAFISVYQNGKKLYGQEATNYLNR